MIDNPWMKFYPADWRSDPQLRLCSIGARGLWIEMLSIMHEADKYGYMIIADMPLTIEQVSILAGVPLDETGELVLELEKAKVFSRDRNGTIYSRRMVSDAKKAARSRENGKKGGNPSLGKQKDNSEWVNPKLSPKKPEARSQKPDKEDASASSALARLCSEIEKAANADPTKNAVWATQLHSTANIWLDKAKSSGIGEDRAIEIIVLKVKSRAAGMQSIASPKYFNGAVDDAIREEASRRTADGGYKPGRYGVAPVKESKPTERVNN